jgi:hypothetical protein
MPALDEETIKELKTDKIAGLLEEIITNTVLDILSRLDQRRQEHHPSMICYKTACSCRDNIPF